jgi:hypothetical protein
VSAAARSVADIPVAHTPPGGYGDAMPPPILAGATDPLVAGAPDLRGIWEPVEVTVEGGIVHDMRADGIEDHGVHDVMAGDLATPLVVTAAYEDEALVLRPRDLPGVEVRRWRDGERLVWRYHTVFTATLVRVDR